MKPRHLLFIMLTLVLTLGLTVSLPQAAVFHVDHTGDDTVQTCDDTMPNDCSLRGAILAANALSEASTINVPAGTYILSQSSTCTYRVKDSTPGIFTSSQVPLCLSKQITLQGAGAASTIIDGDQRGHVLFVSADAVAEVRGMTLTNGIGSAVFFSGQRGGGGIHNHGALTLVETVVSNNRLPTSGGARGAGIHNIGALTLRRSAVVNNSAVSGSGGGGIYNEGFFVGGSTLMVSDSTISDNTIGSNGGGILNGGATTIINSTVSGNTASTGFGGGIANLHGGGNFTARLTVINSILSGNTCGTAGGGIYNGGGTTAHFNNVTITNNIAGTSAAASRSGGGVNNQGPSNEFTLQNTIIAGNRDLGLVPAPDCFAEAGNGTPVASRGYNLIQDTAHCTILGDTTGNLTGVDPLLGPLSDNGGLTQTHALLPGSPALDAGNPAAPGSGGTACAAIDQRGFNRLQDGDDDGTGRCDIGAFELAESAVGFSFSGIRPNAAGNNGSSYALLYGSGFVSGMTVELRRAGEAPIAGAPVTVNAGGAVAAISFALTGRPTGLWDVVITNPDGASKTLTGGFSIEAGGSPQLWSDVIGPSVVRVGRPARFTLIVGNRGNVDARAVPVRIAVQNGVTVGVSFPLTAPPFQTGQVRTVWSQTPLDAPTADGTSNIPLLLPLLPAGFTATFELALTAAESADGKEFVLRGLVDPPLFAPGLDPQFVDDLVAGARAYAEKDIGITIPQEFVPDLKQYLTNQLAKVVENGRNALVANVGAQSQVYSRAWLLVDLARYGAVLAGAQPPSPLSQIGGNEIGAHEPLRVVTTIMLEAAKNIYNTIVYLVTPTAASAQVLTEGSSSKVGCNDNGGRFVGCIDGDKVLGITCCPKGMSEKGCCGDGGGPFRGVRGKDPNDKVGSRGAGMAQYLAGEEPLRYTILFENVETATAAAQEVVITDQLDGSKVNFDTLSLGAISFGDTTVTPPPGLSQYSTSVDLRPANDLIVGIDARLDKTTGLLTWRFTSIDPLTGQFTEDPLAGFLPPNVNPPEGDGSVLFTIKSKVTGTPICNQASIVFDVNAPILTPEWCNSIDVTPPSSAVQSLSATQATPDFPVQWAGSDSGAGIDSYSVFVATDGDSYVPWLEHTTEVSSVFSGQAGHSYAFYSVAQDLVGNVEAAPAQPDTTTRVAGVAVEICGNCLDDDGDGKIDGQDADCAAAPLMVKKGALNLVKPTPGDEKLSLTGSFALAAVNPPVEGVTVSFLQPGTGEEDPDEVLACIQIPPGAQGWKTDRTGTKWTFKDARGGPLGDPNSKDAVTIKFNAKKQQYEVSVAISEAEVEALEEGMVSTQLSVGSQGWENSQAWRLKAKGKQLVTP